MMEFAEFSASIGLSELQLSLLVGRSESVWRAWLVFGMMLADVQHNYDACIVAGHSRYVCGQ